MSAMKASDCIEAALKTFKERAAVYGDSYTRHGAVMAALFPDGLTLTTQDDYNRFGILNMQVSKLIRYTQSWEDRHIDSSHDMGVYCFMQEELDRAFHGPKSSNFKDAVKYIPVEVYDNLIKYDGKPIYNGSTKKFTKEDINVLIERYKQEEEL